MEKILREILEKLEFTMAHIHLQVDDKVVTIADLYEEMKEGQQKEAQVLAKIELPLEQIDSLIEYAFRTSNYKVEVENNQTIMIITKDSSITKIPMDVVNERINGNDT